MPAPLKNQLNEAFVDRLAGLVSKASPRFSPTDFKKSLLGEKWRRLELKERVRALSTALHNHLNGSYKQKISVLKKVAPHISGLGAMVFPDFVEVYGRHDFPLSVQAIKFFTPFFSSEFAVRPFIQRDQKKMMRILLQWSKDKDPHVRRLASEGCRPRLPWGLRLNGLIEDPSPILPILKNLKADPSLYVRKSVANNLNDLSKDHPNLVISLARDWKGKNIHTDWVLKQGLRTLLKKGHSVVFALFDMEAAEDVAVRGLRLKQSSYDIGARLEFSFSLLKEGKETKKLRVDYLIHYLKKNGTAHKKVFKLTERLFAPGRHPLSRRHSLKQMTTRTHYPGQHQLEIAVNGVVKASAFFHLNP
ncbi:MAG: putative protein YhaZ [Elusimicrobia bacterium]|nr:putative protein YhaZ [Elusimicrobiota bacterium]